jgi:hypothetical protein
MNEGLGDLSGDGCPKGPRPHLHPRAMALALGLFVVAVILRSWGGAVLVLIVGSSLALVWGIRHEEDGATGINGPSS